MAFNYRQTDSLILDFLVPVLSVPAVGAIVRYRAHYSPTRIQLEAEQDELPSDAFLSTERTVLIIYKVYKRIYSIEGASGLFKGIMPTLLLSLVSTAFRSATGMFMEPNSFDHLPYYINLSERLVQTILLLLITLPLLVIVNRAIVTPKRLKWFSPKLGLRVLLTPAERRRPWLIYRMPGLVASQIAYALYISLVLRNIRHLLIPFFDPNRKDANFWFYLRARTVEAVIFIIITMVSTVVLAPLDVISVRLLVQRNYGESEPDTEDENADVPEYGSGGPVISLRDEGKLYGGLVDAWRTIVEEEGRWVLYRLWRLSMLRGFSNVIS